MGMGMAEQRAGHFQALHSAATATSRAPHLQEKLLGFVADGACVALLGLGRERLKKAYYLFTVPVNVWNTRAGRGFSEQFFSTKLKITQVFKDVKSFKVVETEGVSWLPFS